MRSFNQEGDHYRLEQNTQDSNMYSELRNHHVKRLLNHLGGKDVPPYLQKAIKRAFSELIEDINNMEDSNDDQETNHNC